MGLTLTPQLEALIQQKLASGKYSSASEVVGEALGLMEAQDQLEAVKLERLRRDIQIGLHSGPATPWDPEEIKRDGRRQRLEQR
jgi:antitoxin ParD1/3/4